MLCGITICCICSRFYRRIVPLLADALLAAWGREARSLPGHRRDLMRAREATIAGHLVPHAHLIANPRPLGLTPR